MTLAKSKGRIAKPNFFQFLRCGVVGENKLQAEKKNQREIDGRVSRHGWLLYCIDLEIGLVGVVADFNQSSFPHAFSRNPDGIGLDPRRKHSGATFRAFLFTRIFSNEHGS
jgi:hypothetical protein